MPGSLSVSTISTNISNEASRSASSSPRSLQRQRTEDLQLERAQSQQEVDQALPLLPEEQRLAEALKKRITDAEKAVMLLFNRGSAGAHRADGLCTVANPAPNPVELPDPDPDALLHCTVERYLSLDESGVSGVERLVELEEMALEHLSAFLGVQLVPLRKSVNYEATPSCELVFAPGEAPTQDQVDAWEGQYRALDEAILRLAGTTGGAQTFKDGRRVASLERVIEIVISSPNQSVQRPEVGGEARNTGAHRAPKILEIVKKFGDIERDHATWLMRAAKMEELVLEVLLFEPMKRSVANVAAAQ